MNIRDLNEKDRMTLEIIVSKTIESKRELGQFMEKHNIDRDFMISYLLYKELEGE